MDAIALPRRFGKPDLFVTMTANPQWPEITSAIPPGSHWQHHPDIVARVFYLKLMAMIDFIVKKELFGEVLAYVFRIEWQARGMPHAHCLFILRVKIQCARHIDTVVWAEIPCPRKYPVLHEIVCRRMIHGPCNLDDESPCRNKKVKGECYRHFPKNFNTVTTIVGDGYPEYRRRGQVVANRDNIQIDDRWVVPYNPFLLETFDCHINTEICTHKRYCIVTFDNAYVFVTEAQVL